MKSKQSELLETQPKLPWDETDQPRERFQKLGDVVRNIAIETKPVDFDIFLDRYLQMLWSLSISAPLRLKTLNGVPRQRFEVFIDGVQIV